jgi:NTE family protein
MDPTMHRRSFLKASALAPAAVAFGSAPGFGGQVAQPLADLAASLDVRLFASDGLAVPIADTPTPSPLAVGLDRTLVLGGGGTYYLAWYCGFFHGLFEQGIDAPSLAQMIVGTSAGSYAGSSMASGHFQRMRTEFDFFGHFPKLFAKLAPLSEPNVSQQRAQKINAAAKDGSLATRQIIGRASLAADNHLNGAGVERLAALLTGDSKTSWPTAKMHTTAVDCYSGDRIVVSQDTAKKNNIPLTHGAAASCSLPGIIGPTLLGQRYCMDGGMCSNPAHVDLVAGSKRALIVTLNDGLNPPFLTGIPHPIGENIRQVEATGTKTLWIKADPPNVNLMNPKEIGPALHAGYDRAKLEAAEIKAFWS